MLVIKQPDVPIPILDIGWILQLFLYILAADFVNVGGVVEYEMQEEMVEWSHVDGRVVLEERQHFVDLGDDGLQ